MVACSPNQRIMNSSVTTSDPVNVEPAASGFESDLQATRTANFTFIYVLRRKDGNELAADDRRFAGDNIPTEMNRKTVSDSGKAIIVGSNFRMPLENQNVLSDRFAFEDLSNPQNAIESNSTKR